MIDLSFVQECVTESEENVRDSLDMVYIKNQMILERIMESTDEKFSEDFVCYLEAANPKVGSSRELSVYSFENSHIIRAIKYFNKAYKELDFSNTQFADYKVAQERGSRTERKQYKEDKIYTPELIKEVRSKFMKPSGNFVKGFEELEEQFDCRFKVNLSIRSSTGTYLLKFPENEKVSSISISKTKGFQLDKLPIALSVNVKQVLDICPNNKKLFGQTFVGIVLHEIYHNIVHCVDMRNKNLHADIKRTFMNIKSDESKESCRNKIRSFVERFKTSFVVKGNQMDEKRTEARLYVLTQIKDNTNAVRQFEKDIKDRQDRTDESELDDYINQLKSIKSVLSIAKGLHVVSAVCVILLTAVGFLFGIAAAAIVGTIGLVCIALSMLLKAVRSLVGVSVGVKEEYFCDLFAAMYKLPIHITSYNRQITLNKKYSEKVSQIRGLTNDISEQINDPHPETFHRELVSYRVAKQLLDSKQKLQPEIKRYLKYIVNLHEGIEDVNVPESEFQNKKLDPAAAKDLQKALDDFVKKSGVSVTESYIEGGE